MARKSKTWSIDSNTGGDRWIEKVHYSDIKTGKLVLYFEERLIEFHTYLYKTNEELRGARSIWLGLFILSIIGLLSVIRESREFIFCIGIMMLLVNVGFLSDVVGKYIKQKKAFDELFNISAYLWAARLSVWYKYDSTQSRNTCECYQCGSYSKNIQIKISEASEVSKDWAPYRLNKKWGFNKYMIYLKEYFQPDETIKSICKCSKQ